RGRRFAAAWRKNRSSSAAARRTYTDRDEAGRGTPGMPLIETVTMALAAAALGYLAVVLWRRHSVPSEENGMRMSMAEAGEQRAAARSEARQPPGGREPDEGNPLAVFAEQPLFMRL